MACSSGRSSPGCSLWFCSQCSEWLLFPPVHWLQQFHLSVSVAHNLWFCMLVFSRSDFFFFQHPFVQVISMQRRADLYLHDLVVNMVSVDRYCCHKCLQLLDWLLNFFCENLYKLCIPAASQGKCVKWACGFSWRNQILGVAVLY